MSIAGSVHQLARCILNIRNISSASIGDAVSSSPEQPSNANHGCTPALVYVPPPATAVHLEVHPSHSK